MDVEVAIDVNCVEAEFSTLPVVARIVLFFDSVLLVVNELFEELTYTVFVRLTVSNVVFMLSPYFVVVLAVASIRFECEYVVGS